MAQLISYVISGSAFVLWLFLTVVEGDKLAVKGSMGNKGFCRSVRYKTHWLSEESSALIIGKSEGRMSKECSIVFGASTDASNNVRLRLHFDFIYFDSCGVKLQINQSSTSDFENSKDNREMYLSGCNHKNPGPLYAQPKHYVLISLNKVNDRLEGYNFRLNVSMTEHLPVTGMPLRIVIIVSFVCFVVVVTTAFLLVKYANRVSIEWNGERREEAMNRAINLYNTRDPLHDESTMAYIEPGVALRSNGHQATRPEIAFVHGDGRVERFQPLVDQEQVDIPERVPQSTSQRLTDNGDGSPVEEPTHFYLNFLQDRHNSSRGTSPNTSEPTPCNVADTIETSSTGGLELPPSYEEALGMPLPSSSDGGGNSDNVEKTTIKEIAVPDADLISFRDDSVNYTNLPVNLQLLDTAAEGTEEQEVEAKESASCGPFFSNQN